ncbi:DUF2290 domain-containing protein [Amycolatopsis sp. QT-25]|uniref:DUF2290 domain-containing protein n=1 Tax=Amycolatopsis sp. QT-25 TaxID=3034022 RepID=UPI0023EC6D06|nr:DUF2290 domain-containing protein [Amycolatopsis sp. QT-25]WET80541.1 DUF2290 domain-containing protein [Amycolatopsis sp. QT-25]
MASSSPSAKSLIKDIKAISAFLIEKSLADDANFPTVLDGPEKREYVEYVRGADYAGMLRDVPYRKVYEAQALGRQYNLRMLDGALLQMSYELKGGELEKSRHAYLPSPSLLHFHEAADLYYEDDLYLDVVAHREVLVPIRFDYDSREGVSSSLRHPVSHLTLGQFKECRIAATGPMTPYFFTEFILRSFYDRPGQVVSDLLPVSDAKWSGCSTREEVDRVHIGIPVT